MSKIQKMSKNTDFSKVEITRAGYYPAVHRHINSPTWSNDAVIHSGENNIFRKSVGLLEEAPAFSLSDCELAERVYSRYRTLALQMADEQ